MTYRSDLDAADLGKIVFFSFFRMGKNNHSGALGTVASQIIPSRAVRITVPWCAAAENPTKLPAPPS